MKYESKYDMGQAVWMVRQQDIYRVVKCPACQQTGKITIGPEEFICPKCSGCAAHRQYAGKKHYVSDYGKIGVVRVVDHPGSERDYEGQESQSGFRVEYMIDSTGIGSGQVWFQTQIFATDAEAQAYCDSQNGVLLADECEMGVETQ